MGSGETASQGGELNAAEIADCGLDPAVVAEHQAKIRGQLERGVGVTFPILESGTLDNQVVLRLQGLDRGVLADSAREGLAHAELCTFVPAAGAASRYLKVFDALHAAVAAGTTEAIAASATELRGLGSLEDLPFGITPPTETSQRALVDYGLEVWKRYGALPKGLMPATTDGLTFFELKLIEHRTLNPRGALAVVVGEGMKERFLEGLHAAKVSEDLRSRVHFLIQGKQLSTLRFDARGAPARDGRGALLPVVAGHGELIRLIPEVAGFGPHHSIFILNIDNVIGTTDRVVAEVERLFGFHRMLLGLLQSLREACRKRVLTPEVGLRAKDLAKGAGVEITGIEGPELLRELQRKLFHSPISNLDAEGSEVWSELERLFDRPLTVQGLVPNSGEDVGGIPVFVELDGQRVKICLEMPHATAEDQATYFRDPKRATHFNPVFVMHELRPQIPASRRTDPRFWMLTRKPYRGREVYYHETVLYEALGNSLTNNVVFVEIPRFLFHPHKVFTDTRGKSADDYGFDSP